MAKFAGALNGTYLHATITNSPAGAWRWELTLIPKIGPCAGIFRGINPLIPLMLVRNGLVYLSVPSPQYTQLLVSVTYTATPRLIFSIS
jgi:hypothetical protein